MHTLVWLLVLGGVLYLIMRIGRGAQMAADTEADMQAAVAAAATKPVEGVKNIGALLRGTGTRFVACMSRKRVLAVSGMTARPIISAARDVSTGSKHHQPAIPK